MTLMRMVRPVLRTNENPTREALGLALSVIGWPCINTGSNLSLDEF